jgi:hypothetical protein
VVDPKKFILPSLLSGFDSETELDLGDCSKWIRVERDPALCELHNRDVGILCGWPNFRKKVMCFCASLFDLLHVFVQVFFLLRV